MASCAWRFVPTKRMLRPRSSPIKDVTKAMASRNIFCVFCRSMMLMPLRSPKMYSFIFGFQRLVWWPKCTPASRSSFIVSVAMRPPSVCPPPRSGASLRPNVRGARDGVLRRVLTVDPYVLLAEVAGEDLLLSAPQPQVDRDGVLLPCHDLADPLEAHAVPQHAPLDDPLVLKEDRDLLLLHARGRLAEGHHDPPPVGVSAVDRALHQRRVRHAARGQQGVATAGRAAYGDGDELGRALAVGDQHPRELRHERPEPGGELAQAPPALLERRALGEAVGQHRDGV